MLKKISIITPTYNEEENIKDCYNSVKEFFNSYKNEYEYEHIFVDNSSTDGTAQIIKDFSKEDRRIKIIINQQNYGILPSIFNALNYCKSNYTLVCYAVDLQDPIDFLDEALKKTNKGSEIIEIFVDLKKHLYPKLASKINPDGSMFTPPLEDLYPFLDRDEFNENMISRK